MDGIKRLTLVLVSVSDDRYTCSSANFSTNGTSYQRVCGRARGNQKGVSHSFRTYHSDGQTTIGGRLILYADGLLITYGNPRQHIWSYVVGWHDNRTYTYLNCPCTVGGGLAPPPLWELTITVNQELLTLIVLQPITLKTHCGTDLIVTVVLTVVLTLLNHGSTDS